MFTTAGRRHAVPVRRSHPDRCLVHRRSRHGEHTGHFEEDPTMRHPGRRRILLIMLVKMLHGRVWAMNAYHVHRRRILGTASANTVTGRVYVDVPP